MTTSLHAINFEQYVLCFLMDNENGLSFLKVKPKVEHFYADRHKEIFKVIESLAFQGKPYDYEIVLDQLKTLGLDYKVGGEEYFKEMMSNFAAPSAVNGFHEKLIKLEECRRVEEVGNKILELSRNTMIDDMPRIAQELASGLETVFVSDSTISLTESAAEALSVIHDKLTHKKENRGTAYGVNTGLRDLDATLGDIEPSHLCVIAAAPGGGKTTLAQMIALNAVKKNNAPTIFFSCEMAHYEITNRIISAECRIPIERIQNGTMDSDDYERWVQTTATVFPNYKLDIVDKAAISIGEIRSEIQRTIKRHGKIGCVIVDYLQLVEDKNAKDNFEKISNVSTGLKRIAKDFKVPVIALSQLTKEAQGRRITMSDLRGSGQISQDADKIILLHPDEKTLGLIVANVAKNRQGPKGESRLISAFDICQFGNIRRKDDF